MGMHLWKRGRRWYRNHPLQVQTLAIPPIQFWCNVKYMTQNEKRIVELEYAMELLDKIMQIKVTSLGVVEELGALKFKSKVLDLLSTQPSQE